MLEVMLNDSLAHFSPLMIFTYHRPVFLLCWMTICQELIGGVLWSGKYVRIWCCLFVYKPMSLYNLYSCPCEVPTGASLGYTCNLLYMHAVAKCRQCSFRCPLPWQQNLYSYWACTIVTLLLRLFLQYARPRTSSNWKSAWREKTALSVSDHNSVVQLAKTVQECPISLCIWCNIRKLLWVII